MEDRGQVDKMIPQEQVAYFAGFFDGEGSICIARNKPKKSYTQGTPQHFILLQISNCNYPVLDYLHNIFGGTLSSAGKSSSGKPVFRLSWAATSARQVLGLIADTLVSKRDVAYLAIEFHDSRTLTRGHRPSQEELIKREWYKTRISEINAVD